MASSHLVNLSTHVNIMWERTNQVNMDMVKPDSWHCKCGERGSGMLVDLHLLALEASTCPSTDVTVDARLHIACYDKTLGSTNTRMR